MKVLRDDSRARGRGRMSNEIFEKVAVNRINTNTKVFEIYSYELPKDI